MSERATEQSAAGPATVATPAPAAVPAMPPAPGSDTAPAMRAPSRPVITPTPALPAKPAKERFARWRQRGLKKAPVAPAGPVAKAMRPPRRARLRLARVDPWSVMKTAFLLSIALAVVSVVAVVVVWSVLGAAGVWDSVNSTVQGLIGEESAGFDVENYLGMSRVVGFTMLVSAIDVVLLTALATLGAFLYNMSAALLGGIEITLVEDR